MPHPNATNPRTGKRFLWEKQQADAKAERKAAVESGAVEDAKHLALLKRQKKAIEARDNLLTFIEFTMPDPDDPANVDKSKYKAARHHKAIIRTVEEVEAGRIPMLILVTAPRMGKSEIVSRRLPAWYSGRHPDQFVLVGTYSDTFAESFGKDVRNIMRSPQYRQVFPENRLARGGESSSTLITQAGGKLMFRGRQGGATGEGAHCFPSETRVETPQGPKRIADVRPGDEVLSYDERAGIVYRTVEAVARRPRSRLLRITTAAGRVVEATCDHPFYVEGRWVNAGMLAVGDNLLCAVRNQSRHGMRQVSQEGAQFERAGDIIASVEETGRSADVYDIQVGGTECFFAEGILAHNCLICDDLIKDAAEGRSQAARDEAWEWFTKVAMTRRMGLKLVILTFTRWSADDPIGRLTDPDSTYYNAALAAKFKIILLPAIAEENDPLGRKVGEALWPDGPDKYDLDFLEEQRMLNPSGFQSLYQGSPSAADGDLFKREDVQYFDPAQPERIPDLRWYCTSDHAVGIKQQNDPSCFLRGGLAANGDLYLTDCFWRRVKTDKAVEMMLLMGAGSGEKNPLLWFAESGHISKSIGPFLYKRMAETNAYFNLRELTPSQDKPTRAQSIIGRVALRKVFFPKGAPWTEKAIDEMMAFPNGTHDDFVDALALFGLGLRSQFGAGKTTAAAAPPATMTLAWVKQAETWRAQQEQLRRRGGF